MATVNETFIKPNLIIEVFQFLFGDGILLSLSFIKVIYFLIVISGLFTVIGLFSKYSIPLIAFLYTFIIAYMWSLVKFIIKDQFFMLVLSLWLFQKEVQMPIPWMLILDYKNLKIIYGNMAKCDINDCSFKRLLFSLAYGRYSIREVLNG